MTDITLDFYLVEMTAAARAAWTPVPGTAPGPSGQYLLPVVIESDTGAAYYWDEQNGGTWKVWPKVGTSEPQGRLTLTTAVPVLAADVAGATTIYYALYKGNQVPIYNGTTFVATTFTELSQATTDNTKSPAACANNSNYDLFVWNDSGTIRCTRGPAWTSDTGRGTGAGTTELERVAGMWVNKIAITNGPAAQRGTYVGTVRTNGSAQVDMKFDGTGAAGGSASNVGVWNAYNRLPLDVVNFDNTDSWNYTTATIRIKNNNAANKIQFVIGLSEDAIEAFNTMTDTNTNASVFRATLIALDSVTTKTQYGANSSIAGLAAFGTFTHLNAYKQPRAPLGFHYLAPLEFSEATGTTTWFGDFGADIIMNSLFTARIFC